MLNEEDSISAETGANVHMNPNMNVGGMGEVVLPNVEGVRDGSGDIPLGTGESKSKKKRKKNKFLSYTQPAAETILSFSEFINQNKIK